MKRIFMAFMLFLTVPTLAQLERIGGGLAFSSGLEFNHYRTGNPGLQVKPYFTVTPALCIVPSITVYNRFKKSTFTYNIRNFMFQGDVDARYRVFRQDPVSFVLLAGLDATALISRYDIVKDTGGLENKSVLAPGLNLGAGLEMGINDYYDATLSARYVAGNYSQFVINLGILYYFYPQHHRHGR